MEKFSRTFLFLAASWSAFLISGCNESGDMRTREITATHCETDTAQERASFILQCIANANPKSDEEPEDWILFCQSMAERTLCEKKVMLVTERCVGSLPCTWVEEKREPKVINP